MRRRDEHLRKIPATAAKEETEARLRRHDSWFYEFVFENGATTGPVAEDLARIHQTRADAIFPFVDRYFAARWQGIRCLDVACHQGWFATQIALRGPRIVEGVDIREEHVSRGRLVRDLGGIENLDFQTGDVYDLKGREPYDLTLMLGLLYHLDHPLGSLRQIRSVTSELCILETQVARAEGELWCRWGSGQDRRGPGIAVVAADDVHTGEPSGLSLVPTLPALYELLYAVGFSNLWVAVPPQSAHEQYRFPGADRVVVFAQV